MWTARLLVDWIQPKTQGCYDHPAARDAEVAREVQKTVGWREGRRGKPKLTTKGHGQQGQSDLNSTVGYDLNSTVAWQAGESGLQARSGPRTMFDTPALHCERYNFESILKNRSLRGFCWLSCVFDLR